MKVNSVHRKQECSVKIFKERTPEVKDGYQYFEKE